MYIYIYIYIYIYRERERERERERCVWEEMNLYLKRGVHMCRCILAKKGMCL
jgi:hypothetical protein